MLPSLARLAPGALQSPDAVGTKRRRLPWQPHQDDCGECTEPDDEACAICLEKMRGGPKQPTWGACGHRFHSRCMEGWRSRRGHPSCPTCRADDPPPVRFDGSDAPHGWRVVVTTTAPEYEGREDESWTEVNLHVLDQPALERLVAWALHQGPPHGEPINWTGNDIVVDDPSAVRNAMWYEMLFADSPTIMVHSVHRPNAEEPVYVTTLSRRAPGQQDEHVEEDA